MAAVDLPNHKMNLKILLVLSFGHLVTDIYQGALPTLLPFLKARMSLTYTMSGVILMAANFTSSIMQPLFGHLSDKKEKIFLLPFGCLAAGMGLSCLSFPSQYGFVLLLVMVSGLGVAAYHPEGYKTAHFFTGKNLATGMAVFSVGGNLGFALGPMIALGIVTHLGFEVLPDILFPFFNVIHISSDLRELSKACASGNQEADRSKPS
jgi:MFS transporter, FSR family, fosmidomycin resistance protein